MKKILVFLIIIYTCIFTVNCLAVEDDFNFSWIRGKSLSNFFNVISRVKKDEVLLELDFKEILKYKLEYNINPDEKITITVDKRQTDFDFIYEVKEWDGTGYNNNITKSNYMDVDYKEWDFVEQKYVEPNMGDKERIEYTIFKTDAMKGKIFFVKDQIIKCFWDVASEKLYISTTGLKESRIYTFKMFANDESVERKKLNILKQLSMKSKPTHWVKDGVLEDKKYIDLSVDADQKIGSRPGLQIRIKRPKFYNEIIRDFSLIPDSELSKIQATINIKEKIKLGSGDSSPNVQYIMTLDDMANVNKKCKYDSINQEYVIDIIKDDPSLIDDSFLQWTELGYSKIYDTVEVILRNLDDAQYDYDANYGLSDEINYAYSYINYEIERKNINDTYLVINSYNTSGSYEVYMANAKITDINSIAFKKWLIHEDSEGSKKIYVPVNVVRSAEDSQYYTFRIDYKESKESKASRSQLLIYDANNDNKINPPVPILKQVKNLVVLPPQNDGDIEPEKVSFDLVWEKSDKIINMLHDGKKIWFELYINTMLDDYNDIEDPSKKQFYQILKTLYMKKVGTDIYISEDDVNYEKMDLSKENFEKNIVIKDENGWEKIKIPNWIGTGGDLTLPVSGEVSNYIIGNDSMYKNDFFNPGKYNIPGNYFLTMRSYYDADSTNLTNELTVSDYSVPVSMFLDMKEEIIKIPSNIRIQNITTSSFNLLWTDVDINKYVEYMFNPIGINLDSKNYEILLSQSMDSLNNAIAIDEIKDKKLIKYSMHDDIDFIGKFSKSVDDEKLDVDLDNDCIEKLRNNIVLGFEVDDYDICINNLESNVVYYVVVRTKIDAEKNSGEKINRFSNISMIMPVTILKDIPMPGEDENTPPTPERFVLSDEAKDYIKLEWDEAILTIKENESIGYDIIRVNNIPLFKKHNIIESKISDIINESEYKGVKSWQIKDDKVYLYNKETNVYDDDIIDSVESNSEYKIKRFTDNIIESNQIYYYYIRTVRFKNNVSKANSMWKKLVVTTKPLSGPINLKPNYNEYNYNIYYEGVITFDAPISDPSKIPNEYNFGISIKSINDNEYYEANDSKYGCEMIKVLDTAGVGYKRYVYKIKGLEANTKYSVKVRIYDKTKGVLEDGRYPASNFSNRIEIRTQFSQKDYDTENRYKEYIEYFKDKANMLYTSMYWNMYDKSSFVVKLKSDAFIGQIDTLNSKKLYLDTDKDEDEYIYYLPSVVLDKISEEKISLIIKRDDIEIIIPPNIIDEELTEEIEEVKEDILDNKNKDYYLKITLEFDNKKEVYDNNSLTEEIEIIIEVVSLDSEDLNIEDDIVLKVEKLIDNAKNDLVEELDKELDKKIDDDKFFEILEDVMDDLKRDISKEAEDIISDEFDDTEKIDEYYENVIIKYLNANSTTKGYKRKSSKYHDIDIEKSYSIAYIYTKENGIFIFTDSNNEDIYNLDCQYSQSITKVYTKYNLSDVINIEKLEYDNIEVTRDDFVDICIQILKIKSTNTYDDYLKKEDFKNYMNFNNVNPSKDEVIYIIMKLYEQVNGVKIKNMRIDDYTLNKYVVKYLKEYRKSLLIAHKLGIINIKQEDLNDNITYQQLLRYLYLIDKK